MGTYYINRGVANGKLGKLDDAIQDFEKAKKTNPEKASVYTNIGRAYMLKNDYKKAINYLNEGIKIDNKSIPSYLNRAVAKQKSNDLEGAIEDFSKIISIDKNNATAYYSKGKLLILLKRYDEACPILKIAKELGNKNAEILLTQFCK